MWSHGKWHSVAVRWSSINNYSAIYYPSPPHLWFNFLTLVHYQSVYITLHLPFPLWMPISNYTPCHLNAIVCFFSHLFITVFWIFVHFVCDYFPHSLAVSQRQNFQHRVPFFLALIRLVRSLKWWVLKWWCQSVMAPKCWHGNNGAIMFCSDPLMM